MFFKKNIHIILNFKITGSSRMKKEKGVQ